MEEKQFTLFLIASDPQDEAVVLSQNLWEKHCQGIAVEVIAADNYQTALLNYIANEEAPQQAAFVPASTVPVCVVSAADLTVLKSWMVNEDRKKELAAVRKAVNGQCEVRYYIPCELPMVYDKITLAEVLSALKLGNKTINIPTAYAACVYPGFVPYDASISTSRITGLVARSAPNMDVVGAYFAERKFIVTTPEGFTAIREKLENHLAR